MYHKLKNVLHGLAFSAIAVALGLAFGEPASAVSGYRSTHAPVAQSDVTAREPGKDLGGVVRVACPQIAPLRHAILQMPYFSFAGLLSRMPAPPEP